MTTKQAAPKKPAENGKPSLEDTVLKAISVQPEATAADLAAAAALSRSSVSKALARLKHSGEVRRHQGGRDGGRRLPDRWTLAPAKAAANAAAKRRAAAAESPPPASSGGRLKPGELEELILTYMQGHTGEPVGPGAVAKGLQRSSGAVGNALARLARAKKVRQVSDRPRRYEIAP